MAPPEAKGGEPLREPVTPPFGTGVVDDHPQLVHRNGRPEIGQRLPRDLREEGVHPGKRVGRAVQWQLVPPTDRAAELDLDVLRDQFSRRRARRRSISM